MRKICPNCEDRFDDEDDGRDEDTVFCGPDCEYEYQNRVTVTIEEEAKKENGDG